MGEQFLRKRAHRYRFQQDSALEQELAQTNLFSEKPEVFHTDFECTLVDGANVQEGDTVLLRRGPSGGVDVVLINQIVGRPREPAALAVALDIDPRHGGFLAARVQTRSRISTYFYVRVMH